VAIRWTVNNRELTSADNQTSFRLDCVPGNYYAVTVTVATAPAALRTPPASSASAVDRT